MGYSTGSGAPTAKIYVVGVGGGGCNAINTMIESGLKNVKFISCNTDTQALEINKAPTLIQLGENRTRGLGAGANPEVGTQAAMDSADEIREALEGADMVFVTAGMGGGTGTGAAPCIAGIARDMGILTIGVVTTPFHAEGRRRTNVANDGIQNMMDRVDTLIVVPNQSLLKIDEVRKLGIAKAFKYADQVLLNAVRGVSDMILNPGMINLDFADFRQVTSNKSTPWAVMGLGEASGEGCGVKAIQQALNSPLLSHIDIKDAQGALACFTTGEDFSMEEYESGLNYIQGLVADAGEGARNDVQDADAVVISGINTDPKMQGVACRVLVILTGLKAPPPNGEASSKKKSYLPQSVEGFPVRPSCSMTPVPAPHPPQAIDWRTPLPASSCGMPSMGHAPGVPSAAGPLATPLMSLPPTAAADARAAMQDQEAEDSEAVTEIPRPADAQPQSEAAARSNDVIPVQTSLQPQMSMFDSWSDEKAVEYTGMTLKALRASQVPTFLRNQRQSVVLDEAHMAPSPPPHPPLPPPTPRAVPPQSLPFPGTYHSWKDETFDERKPGETGIPSILRIKKAGQD